MKNILVIGMGRFGQRLAERLIELKNHVMIVDRHPGIINELAPHFTDAQIADCTNPDVLKALGVRNFDICFVTIGENFQSSLEISSQLKEMGAKCVVAKANRDIQAKFLLRNGADRVIYPERDMAEKIALTASSDRLYDFVELTPEHSIFEITPFSEWIGKSIGELDIRRKCGINVLTIKKEDGHIMMPGIDYVFEANDHIFILGHNDIVMKRLS